MDTSSHIRLDFKREINTTTTVTLVYPIVDSGVTITSTIALFQSLMAATPEPLLTYYLLTFFGRNQPEWPDTAAVAWTA